MLRVVLFSGGRGSGALLKELATDGVDLTIAINGYDDGASTGEVRRFLGDALGPSDFRKNAARLARERRTCPPSLADAIEQRLPAGAAAADAIAIARRALEDHADARGALERFLTEVAASPRPFDFGDSAIGNLVFAGAFLQEGRSFNAAIDRFCALLGLPPGIIENVTDGTNAYLVGLTRDGSILATEAEIVGGARPNQIDEVFLLDGPLSQDEARALEAKGTAAARAAFDQRQARVRLNERLAEKIAAADLIIYAAGTQHSSLLPSYLTPGVGAVIGRNVRAVKLLLTNLQPDAEIADASAVDIIRRALLYLNGKGATNIPEPCLITHYLVNDPGAGSSRALVPPGPIQLLEDPRLVRIGDFEEGATGRHDPAKAIAPFLRAIPRAASRRIAVVLHDARARNTIAQSLLELARSGTADLAGRMTVFHEGEPLDPSFTELLPFEVSHVPDLDALRAALASGGFEFVVLFDSSGAYHGEDVATLAALMTPGRLDAVWGSRRLSLRDIAGSYRVRYGAKPLAGIVSAIGSHVLSLICLLLYGRYITDTLSGVRAVRTSELLPALASSWRNLNARLLGSLLRRRADILEVPVRFVSQGAERDPSGRLAEGARMLVALITGRVTSIREMAPDSRRAAIARIALVVSLAVSLYAIAGFTAFRYAGLLALAMLPGLPLGFALFGRGHAASWIAGLLFGYTVSVLTFWVIDFVGLSSPAAFIAGWAIVLIAMALAAQRVRAPAIRLSPWGRADAGALMLALLLVPALMTVPFMNIGATDRHGNEAYRAYFTADFVWHTALTAELKKHETPPRDPYLASAPLHYYWTYFIMPATLADGADASVQDALKVNAVGAGLLFVSAIFLAAWVWAPGRPGTVAAAVALTFLAASAQGLAALAGLVQLDLPFAELRNVNVEAVTAWVFHGLRIDTLRRGLWYTPQHSMAAAIGLIGLVIATAAGLRARRAAIVCAGLAFGASVLFNPFVGMVLFGLYAVTVGLEALRTRSFGSLPPHFIAALLVGAALAWSVVNGVLGGVGGVLRVGWFEPARNAPLITIAVALGPILVPAAIALTWGRRYVRAHALPAAVGVGLSLGLMLFVNLSVDTHWVGFRGGHLVQLLAPALVAIGFIQIEGMWGRRAAIFAFVALLAAGLPTTIIDTYNAQDIRNEAMGPGFHWTVRLTPEMAEALQWIRTNTPPGAVVQAEPTVRGRDTWSLIPTFAERRMAAGLPISLMHVPEYDTRSEVVRDIYASHDAQKAWEAAKSLGIDYLYADATERRAYPGVAKFDAHPELFAPVFNNGGATVYAVR